MARKKGGAGSPSTRAAGRRGPGAIPQSKPRETGVSRGDPRWAGRRSRSGRGLRSAERAVFTEGTRRDRYGIPEMFGLVQKGKRQADARERARKRARDYEIGALRAVEVATECERRQTARRESLFALNRVGAGKKPGAKRRKLCR